MNLAYFTKAIVDRITADTSFPSATVTTYFGDANNTPRVVIEVSAEADDTFTQDGLVMTVRFHIFDKWEAGFLAACAPIIERLRGDAAAQANRVPTYGFHRHNLTLEQPVSGMQWAAGLCRYVRSDVSHDSSMYHFIETYEVRQTASTTES